MKNKLSDFRLATKKEIEGAAKKAEGFWAEGIFVGSPGGIHRTYVFKILDECFGPPNIQEGERSTWQWVFYTDEGLLTVYDYKGDWSIGWLCISPSKKLLEIASNLKESLLEEAKKINISRKQIQKGKMGGRLQNPYSIYRKTTNDLMSQSKKIWSDINNLKSKKDIKQTVESMNLELIVGSLYRAAFMSLFLSLEGFLNLVYKLFLKEQYKKDIYEKRMRTEMLPIKILEINSYCHSFSTSPFTEDDKLFSAIKYFTNIRNEILHANICESMESHLVKVGRYYIFSKSEPKETYGLTSNIDNLTNLHIIRAERLVEKFVLRILQSFDKKTKLPFAIVHRYIWIPYYWDKKDTISFPLDQEDIYGAEEAAKYLKQSSILDDTYYKVDEKEFKPIKI